MAHFYDTIKKNFEESADTKVLCGCSEIPNYKMDDIEKNTDNLVKRLNSGEDLDIEKEIDKLFC